MWFKRRKDKAPPAVSPASHMVDLDQDEIPIDDLNNATSLMFAVAMKYDGVMMDHPHPGRSVLHAGGRTYIGDSDLAVLRQALRLESDETTDLGRNSPSTAPQPGDDASAS